MKTADFLNRILTAFSTTIAVTTLLVFYCASTNADSPLPETFIKPPELVLTLPDQMLVSEEQSAFMAQTDSDANKVIAKKSPKKPVKMDCGMDVDQNIGNDDSLTGRLTGACDLRYNY